MQETKRMYDQVANPGIIEIPKGTYDMKISCCDCGLVHNFRFESESPVTITVVRNNRATAQLRRYKNGALHEEDEKWALIRLDNGK